MSPTPSRKPAAASSGLVIDAGLVTFFEDYLLDPLRQQLERQAEDSKAHRDAVDARLTAIDQRLERVQTEIRGSRTDITVANVLNGLTTPTKVWLAAILIALAAIVVLTFRHPDAVERLGGKAIDAAAPKPSSTNTGP